MSYKGAQLEIYLKASCRFGGSSYWGSSNESLHHSRRLLSLDNTGFKNEIYPFKKTKLGYLPSAYRLLRARLFKKASVSVAIFDVFDCLLILENFLLSNPTFVSLFSSLFDNVQLNDLQRM